MSKKDDQRLIYYKGKLIPKEQAKFLKPDAGPDLGLDEIYAEDQRQREERRKEREIQFNEKIKWDRRERERREYEEARKILDKTIREIEETIKKIEQEKTIKKTEQEEREKIELVEDEPLLYQVAQYIVTEKNVSINVIQKEFGIGSNRAQKIIKLLEIKGVVSISEGKKECQALVTKAELENMVSELEMI